MAGKRRGAVGAASGAPPAGDQPVRWRLRDSATGATGPTIVGSLTAAGSSSLRLSLPVEAERATPAAAAARAAAPVVYFEFADPALLEWYGTRALPQPRGRRPGASTRIGGVDAATKTPPQPPRSDDAFDVLLGLMNEASLLHAARTRAAAAENDSAHRQRRRRWYGGCARLCTLLFDRVGAAATRVIAAHPRVADAVDRSLLLSQLACKFDDARTLAAALARLSEGGGGGVERTPVCDAVACHAAAWDAAGRLVLDAAAGVLLAHALSVHARSLSAVAAAHGVNAHLSAAVAWLAGLPLGLKLNRPLAHKLAHAGAALTDVWDAALATAPPVAAGLPSTGAVLTSLAALAGATVALAAAGDLAALLTLHVAVAYKQTCWLHGRLRRVLASLWRLFRGRKTNVLRGRVDSHHAAADAPQALLGTLLFTSLCFLLPTVAVFHALAGAAAAARGGVRLAARVALAAANNAPTFPLVVSAGCCCCRRRRRWWWWYSTHCRPLRVRLEPDSNGRWRLVRVPASGVGDAALVTSRAASAAVGDAALPVALSRALWGT